MNISNLIRSRRTVLNLTQMQLAKKAKVSQAMLSKLEAGLQEPSFTSALTILKALDMNVTLNVKLKGRK